MEDRGVSRRYRPGRRARRGIRKFKKPAHPLLKTAPFKKLVKEIVRKLTDIPHKFEKGAIEALRVASEAFIEEKVRDGTLCAFHAGRTTLMKKDFRLVHRIKGEKPYSSDESD